MKSTHTFYFGILVFLFCSFQAIMAQNSTENTEFYRYTVNNAEGFYSVCRKFNVTQEEIIRYNPTAKDGLKSGQELLIPVKGVSSPQERQNTGAFRHIVSAGETLYSISKAYNVSQQDIIALNPKSKNGIKTGESLLIPQVAPAASTDKYIYHTIAPQETLYALARQYNTDIASILNENPGLSAENFTIGKVVRIISPDQDGTAPTTAASPTGSESGSINRPGEINVAVLLPFMLNEAEDVKSSLYTEFYQGFLLAVDSVRKQGANLNIYAYDTQNSSSRINQIIARPELQSMDLIIGPVNDTYLSTIADFAQRNDINLVNVFSLKNEDVNTNPKIFQTNIPHDNMYAEAIGEFIRRFKNRQIIFINGTKDSDDKIDFTTELKNELNRQHISYSETGIADVSSTAENSIPTDANVVFVPSSGSRNVLNSITAPLCKLAETRADIHITLFGYPEWQTYTKEFLNSYYKLDTYIFTRFYSTPTDSRLRNFEQNFRFWYNKDMINASPKYGLLGFDIGIYFLNALNRYGKNFENSISYVPSSSLQTDFKFDRIYNWGGFINKNLYFVHFTPLYTIERISVK